MLYNYLKENYDDAEPIFYNDIQLEGVSKPALSRMLKSLCDEGKIMKYGTGIYYFPKKTRLSSTVGPNADIVARYKYIERHGKVDGYYTGNTLANKMGLTTQVPMKIEIVSNNMAAKVREVEIGTRKFLVRHPAVYITNENAAVLQMLDLLKNLEIYIDGRYSDAAERFREYIRLYNIKREDVDCYIREYPVNVFRNYYEVGLDYVFA